MNREQMLDKFKGIFKAKVALAVENSVELADGTLMTSNGIDLEVGVEVFSVDAEDNATPMADGNYDLKDGTKFTVKDGMIETYGEYTPEVVVPEPSVEAEEVSPEMDILKAELELVKEDIKAIFEMLNMSSDAVVEMRNQINKANTTLSKIPASMGVQKQKVEKVSGDTNKINEFLEKVKSQKQKIK